MVATNNKVRGAKVLSDDGMPDGLAWSGHPHGKGKESEVSHSIRVFCHDGLVYTYTGEMVDIPRLGESNNRMYKNVGLSQSRCSYGELAMSPVHGIAGLEGHNSVP